MITHIFCIFSLIICSDAAVSSSSLDMNSRLNEMTYGAELGMLVQNILTQIRSHMTCLAVICDNAYQDVFNNEFFFNLGIRTVLQILVKEAEDLLSPNYNTVKVIEQIRRDGCNVILILLTNGEQSSRLLRFGDRHRLIDTRANFLMIYDRRLFLPQLHYLWKKVVNVVFVRRYKETTTFQLSTVPFPAPIRDVLVPRQIDTWRAGKFKVGTSLYYDKTRELDGEILHVAVIEHMPSAVTHLSGNVDGQRSNAFTGIEIEMLNSLKWAMKFKSHVYEPPNSASEAWGQKQLNGSYSGLLGEVANGHADLALGNFYYTPFHLKLLDLSVPYGTECLTFLTPEALTDNSWKTLILPFRLNMWIGILVALVIGATAFYILANIYHSLDIDKYRHNDRKWYNRIKSFISVKATHFQEKLHMFWRFKEKLKFKGWLKGITFWRQNQSRLIRQNFAERRESLIEKLGGRLRRLTLAAAGGISTDNNKFISEGMFLFDTITNSLLYTCGMLFLVSLPRFTTGWALRIMTGCWWIYCILIVVSYRASLTAILATPQPRVTIDTVEQLAASPVRCGGWGEENHKFFITSLDPASQAIGLKFQVVADPQATDAVSDVARGTFAYYGNIYFLRHLRVMQSFQYQSINQDDNAIDSVQPIGTSHHNLHIMSDCVINMPISIGLQKNSPLKPRVDKFIRQFVEAGLIRKWLDDVMLDTLIAEAPLGHEQVKALVDLGKLYVGFVVLLTGYVLSGAVLLAENLHWYLIVKRDPLFDKYLMGKYYDAKQ